MSLSSSYVCPCCFLNRISFLRQSHPFSVERLNSRNSKSFSGNRPSNKPVEETRDYIRSDVSSALTDLTLGSYKINSRNFSDDSEEFMFPERLINSKRLKSDSTFVVDAVLEDPDSSNLQGTQYNCRTTDNSSDRTESLAGQISLVLEEQRKFVREFDLPISDEGGFKLNMAQTGNKGDFLEQSTKTTKRNNKIKMSSTKKLKIDETVRDKTLYFACGDQDSMLPIHETGCADIVLNLESGIKDRYIAKNNKPTVHFNEEPVKLPKNFELTFSTELETDINKNCFADKNISVKMLFFPQNRLDCSSSSFGSLGDKSGADSSVYVTAANSLADFVGGSELSQTLYTMAGSNSNVSLCKTTSKCANLTEIN
uniref:Uncharacterized protein n=2 Tax=Graphocephala atropunctata TaxID=36148 RepID=A0A1B6L150_9HEMI